MKDWINSYAPGEDALILCDVDTDANNLGDIYEEYKYVLSAYGRCSGVPMNFYFDQGLYMYQFYCGRPSQANAESPITAILPPERCE